MPLESTPYFQGNSESELDYAHIKISRGSRHPIFRSVHPFIMMCHIRREFLDKKDPVGELLEFFVDGWRVFADDKYTLFRGGNVLRLNNQAYAEGTFTITEDTPFFWQGSVRHENVHLWRSMVITQYTNNIEVTNMGVPVWGKVGDIYLKQVRTWLGQFRMLNPDADG
jgi:hypothetical protein